MSCKIKTYPFILDYIPDEYIHVAQKELNETQEKRVDYVRELKRMTKDDKSLNGIDFHPDSLLQFLRASKFNIDAALERLRKYVNFRRKQPGFFTGVEERKIFTCPSYRYIRPLPLRSPEGCGVSIMKFGAVDISEIPYEDFQRITYVVMQQALRNPATQINGIKLIMDFENTNYRLLKYATPGNMYQTVQMYLECSAARFKQFHCVNCTMTMKVAWTIVAPFMSEKMRRRVIFHKQPEELLQYFPEHMLPVEYGGVMNDDYYLYTWMKESNYQTSLCTLSGQPNAL